MAPDDARHGTTRGYHAGCHEACCRAAMARYEKAGRLARLEGGRAVPAIGAQRRLQALMRLGWSSEAIATEAGLRHRNHVLRVINGQKGKPTTWLERSTDKWVRDVYERLSMRIPDSPYAKRTRHHAERMGWPPPLAWNDPDDPDEIPHGWQRSVDDWIAELYDLDEQHAGISQALAHLGVTRKSLQKRCERHDLMPLYSRLVDREQDRYWVNQYAQGGAA